MLRHAKILIVESNPFVALNLQRTLHSMGYDAPIAVPTGEEAVELVDSTRVSVVFIELDLKGHMNGKETAKRIRVHDNISVVFMTSDAERCVLETALAANHHACLLKPIRESNLRMAVEKAHRPAKTQTGLAVSYCSGAPIRMAGGSNGIPFTVNAVAFDNPSQLDPQPRVPDSLEAMGVALEGYWEQKPHPDSNNYLEARFKVGSASVLRNNRQAVTRCGKGVRESLKDGIDCVGLDEVCRAADGSVYRVPRLKIKLKAKQARLTER
jgi:CheY-like chemotaxis protein